MKPFLPTLMIAAVAVGGCTSPADVSSRSGRESREVIEKPRIDPIMALADSLTASMSVEERVGQLFMPATFTTTDPATVRRLMRYVADEKVGGIVFLRGDTASMKALARELERKARIPLFLAMDAEWGLGMRLSDAESFPHNSKLSEATETQMYDYGLRVGTQASRLGLNMILGPVLDVARSPGSVMADRSFGADPELVAALGTAYSCGVRDAGVIPVAKHFPGHGATRADSHKTRPVIVRSRPTLDSIDLLPFRQYISMGLPAVMAGHVAMPGISGDSTPASISPKIINGLLREEMGFRGLVLTDAMNMGALPSATGLYVASILAGADIILVPADTRGAVEEVIEALRDGTLPAATVNDRCRRIIYYKLLREDEQD